MASLRRGTFGESPAAQVGKMTDDEKRDLLRDARRYRALDSQLRGINKIIDALTESPLHFPDLGDLSPLCIPTTLSLTGTADADDPLGKFLFNYTQMYYQSGLEDGARTAGADSFEAALKAERDNPAE